MNTQNPTRRRQAQSAAPFTPQASVDTEAPSRQYGRRPCERPARSAFTLIELLVVVAIISVLAAMLLPALSQARKKAKQILCASNLKQVGMMFALYEDENDGYIPPANMRRDYNYLAPNYYHYGYSQALGPYIGQNRWAEIYSASPWIYQFTSADKKILRNTVFVCPTYAGEKTLDNNLLPGNTGYAESKYVEVNYGKDTVSPYPQRIMTWAMPRKLSQATGSPSARIHMAESCRETLGNRVDIISESNNFPNFAIRRHTNSANMLFRDAHVSNAGADTLKQHLTNSFEMPE